MRTQHGRFSALTGAALLILSGPAIAEDDEVTALTTPATSVRFGSGYLDEDAARFGEYTGVREEGSYLMLDLEFVNRNDSTGTWLWMTGHNLGLDDRELSVEHRRQGNWGYFASYSKTPRYNPLLGNTGLDGAGGSSVIVNGVGSLRDLELQTAREAFAAGFDKRVVSALSFAVRARHEDKDGARQFARGTPGAMEFLAEPVEYNTDALEATASYTGARLQLSGGYYGTSFDNVNTALDITGGAAALAGGAIPFTPIALPPDSVAHQMFLTGGYNFTSTARGTFKASYTRQKQEDDFILPSITGRTDLGGRLDVSQAYLGFSSRPLRKLSVLANLRYEERDDQTPIAVYFTGAGPTATTNGENEPRSISTTAGKLEASYQLPAGLRFTGGVDYDEKERSVSAVRVVSARDATRELSYRTELRRSMSETLTGALSFVRSDRDGSPFLTTLLNNGAVGSNLVAPLHLADRERDKMRIMLSWFPIEPLSVQMFADYSKDDYGGRALGPQSGRGRNYSIDVAYDFSDTWHAAVFATRNDVRAEQQTQVSAPTGQLWEADLRNQGDAYGLEIRAQPLPHFEIGTDYQYSRDRDEYLQRAITGAAIAPLPDIRTKQSTLRVFVSRALTASSGVRIDYVNDRWSSDDWAWTNWVYVDGTRFTQDTNQRVNFFVVSGYMTFR